jgi:DegV family protein with EDD domain
LVHKRKVAVVVDSSSCLPRALLEESDIYVVPHELIIDEQSFRDGIDIEPDEFYQLLQKNQKIPSTSSPKPDAFLEAFRSASAVAENVVCITLSTNFSSTYSSASVAARMAEDELAGCHIIKVVDSRAAAGAEGLIALEAARAAQEGADLERVLSRIEELIPKVNLLAFLDTLYYLRRSGRVPRVAAWAGSLLGIKPLTELKLGEARMVDKPRSRAKAMDRLLSVTKDRVRDRPVHVNVMHAQAADGAEHLYRRIEAEFNCQELFISEFTPVMGAHLGPGLLGIAFYTSE